MAEPTKTNLWTTSTGKKLPVELLPDEHLAKAYKLCWVVVYYYERERKSWKKVWPDWSDLMIDQRISDALTGFSILISYEKALKYSMLMEDELKRRKKKTERPKKESIDKYIHGRDSGFYFAKDGFDRIVNPKYLTGTTWR